VGKAKAYLNGSTYWATSMGVQLTLRSNILLAWKNWPSLFYPTVTVKEIIFYNIFRKLGRSREPQRIDNNNEIV